VKDASIHHTKNQSIKQPPLCSLRREWRFAFAAKATGNPESAHPCCSAELFWSQERGGTGSQPPGPLCLSATRAIRFDLRCSSLPRPTHLVQPTAFRTGDAALFPAVSNLKQKGGSGRGVVKLLH